MKTMQSESLWRTVLEQSESEPVVIFKHSNTCPISAAARDRIETGINNNELTAPVFEVVVQENRSLSDTIAEELSVKHESPQVIIVRNGSAIANTSHHDVSAEFILSHIE